MFVFLMMITFSAWCFAQAINLRLDGRAGRDRRSDPVHPSPSAQRPEPEQSFAMPEVASPRPVNPARRAHRERSNPEPDEAVTADLCTQNEESPRELVVEIHRRELGGGETLACLVRWDGFRARWDPVDLPSDTVAELQRLVLQRTGLWPGHGRIYVEAVARALDDPWGRSRWRIERVSRGAA